MKKQLIAFSVLACASSLALCACGKNNGNNNEEMPAIIDDLERDENGKFDVNLLDNVQLNLWSVIGQPDQVVLENQVKEFNKQFAGLIEIKLKSVGHYDYYNALDSTYVNDYGNFPDVCFMHNEKNIEYAVKGYFHPVDELISQLEIDLNFNNVYDNIEKTTIKDNKHYGIPVDAHGYLAQIRQDIIKKNGLGFDENTRFIPNSYDEYEQLLNALRDKADTGDLYVRNINKGENHEWYKLVHGNKETAKTPIIENFYPAFFHSQECDNLSALYVNGGSLMDSNGNVNFQNNVGFMKYVTDSVERFNKDLTGDAGNKEAAFPTGQIVMFSEGPWQVANTYDYWWNNSDLVTAGKLGVTEEDANDPILSKPYTVSRPRWFASSTAPAENANKWYGNGHVITLTRKITSLKKAAAALTFASWYTQAKTNNSYNLVNWCKAGHLPAWKNVYDSQEYKTAENDSMTLKAMGDPSQIISLESSEYATTLINGVNVAVGNVAAALLGKEGCTVELARQKVNEVAASTQEAINLLKLGL